LAAMLGGLFQFLQTFCKPSVSPGAFS